MDNLNKRLEDVKIGSAKFNKKSFVKFGLIFLAIVAAVVVFFPIIREKYQARSMNKFFNDYFKWEEDYKNTLKNDTYGGKTPQEVYEKFIDALKKGDILTAARFFMRSEDKVKYYKMLDEIQKKGELEKWVSERAKWVDMKEIEYWYEKGKEFEYDYVRKEDYKYYEPAIRGEMTIPAGKYIGSIVFYQSNASGLWKIYEL